MRGCVIPALSHAATRRPRIQMTADVVLYIRRGRLVNPSLGGEDAEDEEKKKKAVEDLAVRCRNLLQPHRV